jgi:protoporphyrinogen oxidase
MMLAPKVANAIGAVRRWKPDDLVTSYVGRLRHAQPVCPPDFAEMLPPVETPIRGLQIADTCFYYPEDRGIAESIRLGRAMADRVA